jgi:hypothetical protein
VAAARQAKAAVPGLVMVGSGYTYLQDDIVHAAQATVRQGWIDMVGLGRRIRDRPIAHPKGDAAIRPLDERS